MTKRTLLALAILIACGAGAAEAQAPVADFFSTTSIMDGQGLPPGTTIEAYDSDGILCGYAEANLDGHFLVHVYGNDPMTANIDEGAREGELLQWRLAGVDVQPEDAQWIANLIGLFADLRWENGGAKEIQLEVRTTKTSPQTWSEVKTHYRP